MYRIRFTTVITSLGLAALLGVAAQAAEPAASAPAPLDLTLPREAGRWNGLASRVRPDPAWRGDRARGDSEPDSRHRSPHAAAPYGTGYEARMSAGPAPVARGGHGRGR